MSWHYYPFIHGLALSSCLLACAVAVLAWRRRPGAGAVPTVALMLAMILWTVMAGLEDASSRLAVKWLCYAVEFLAFNAVPVIWLILLLDYLGYRHVLTRRNILLLCLVPLMCILLCWTNSFHGLVFSRIAVNVSSGIPYLELSYHLGFWVFIVYAYLLLFFGMTVCVFAVLSSVATCRRQAFVLLACGLVPTVVSIFDFTYAFLPAWNLTPIAFLFSGVLLVWGMYRFRLWDLTPVAYQTVFQKINEGVFIVNTSHRIVEINPAGCAILGITLQEWVGRSIHDLLPKLPGFSPEHLGTVEMKMVIEMVDRPHTYGVSVSPLNPQPGASGGWLAVMRDISESRQLEQQLYAIAYYDGLTGLPNRLLLYDRLAQTIKYNQRHHTSAGVIFLDLDHFKEINDDYGHAVGDLILQETARRLKHAVRESDTVARLGGDEFVVVLPAVTGEAALVDTAQRLLHAFALPVTLQGCTLQLTPSLGVVLIGTESDTVDRVLTQADAAMYAAKHSGGSRFILYHADDRDVSHRH